MIKELNPDWDIRIYANNCPFYTEVDGCTIWDKGCHDGKDFSLCPLIRDGEVTIKYKRSEDVLAK